MTRLPFTLNFLLSLTVHFAPAFIVCIVFKTHSPFATGSMMISAPEGKTGGGMMLLLQLDAVPQSPLPVNVYPKDPLATTLYIVLAERETAYNSPSSVSPKSEIPVTVGEGVCKVVVAVCVIVSYFTRYRVPVKNLLQHNSP